MVNPERVGFDLKEPCADCPFRLDVPAHGGVAEKLREYMAHIEAGMFSHSCHKTDERSDWERPNKVKGKVQHCVGAIHMCEKSGKGQAGYLAAWCDGEYNLDALKGREKVGTIKQLLRKYYDWAKAELNKK